MILRYIEIRLTEYTLRSISFYFWRESTRDQCWIDPKVCCQWFAINWQQLHPGFIRLRYNNCTLQIVIYIYLSSCTVRCAVRLFPPEGRWAGKKSWKMNTVSITSCKERLGWLCLAFCFDFDFELNHSNLRSETHQFYSSDRRRMSTANYKKNVRCYMYMWRSGFTSGRCG